MINDGTLPERNAWCAGLLEGEGSFICYKLHNRKDSYRISVSISMTDEDVLQTFTRFIGVGKVKGPYKHPSRKDRYTWEVQNFRDCLSVCKRVYPYMHSRRREKIRELIKICESRVK